MIFYNIGINIPNFLCWIPNMKFACVQTSPVISFVARGKGATKEIGDVCTQANMKSVFWRQKNPKLDPKFSHNIYQHWNEHSQCMTSISQHPLWNCISQWNPKKLPSIPQHWETNSHDWVMNLRILRKFPIRELVIFSCGTRRVLLVMPRYLESTGFSGNGLPFGKHLTSLS